MVDTIIPLVGSRIRTDEVVVQNSNSNSVSICVQVDCSGGDVDREIGKDDLIQTKVESVLEDVEEQRFYVEEIRKTLDIQDVGDLLAAGKEQENMDSLLEEAPEIPDFQHLHPDLLENNQEKTSHVSEYGRITLTGRGIGKL